MNNNQFIFRDYKFKPFLSPFALKLFAAIFFCIAQLATALKFNLYYSNSDLFKNEIEILTTFFQYVAELSKLSVPLIIVWIVANIFKIKKALPKWLLHMH